MFEPVRLAGCWFRVCRRNDLLYWGRWRKYLSLVISSSTKAGMMAEINKLSVEKTLNKLRSNDAKQSKEVVFSDKIDVIEEQIGRMRAQRLRLEHHQGNDHQERHATAAPSPRYTFWKAGLALVLIFALMGLWLYGSLK